MYCIFCFVSLLWIVFLYVLHLLFCIASLNCMSLWIAFTVLYRFFELYFFMYYICCFVSLLWIVFLYVLLLLFCIASLNCISLCITFAVLYRFFELYFFMYCIYCFVSLLCLVCLYGSLLCFVLLCALFYCSAPPLWHRIYSSKVNSLMLQLDLNDSFERNFLQKRNDSDSPCWKKELH